MPCSSCSRDVEITFKAKNLCSACHTRLKRHGTVERKNVIRQPLCSVADCGKPTLARNLCTHHYARADHPLKDLWKGLRSRSKGQYPIVWDDFAAFVAEVGERPSQRHQLRRLNPTLPWSKENVTWLCVVPGSTRQTMTPEWRKAYGKEWNLRDKFGITGDEFAAMSKSQHGCCAICEKAEVALNPHTGRARELAVDHDHETGVNRGLLCVRCNRMIGYAQDDIATLMKAITYLRRHSAKLKVVS